MNRPRSLPLGIVFALALLSLLVLAGPPTLRSTCLIPSQSTSKHTKPPSTSKATIPPKSQTLANPLNDLLDDAQRNIDKQDFQAAIAALQKFIAERPDVAYAHFQLAYAFTALKRTDEARTQYQRATPLDPKMSEAYLNLGMLLLDRDPAAAVAPLRKAVDLLPAQSRPRVLLGIAQERAGNPSAAAETLEGAARLDPQELETLVHLGNLYLAAKRPEEAEAKFRVLLPPPPAEARALLGLAQSLDALNKPDAAAAFRSYLAAHPADSVARARLVHLFVDQQQYTDALAELDRTEAGQPATPDALRLRADILIAQKKWDDAIVTIRQAIALSSQDAQLHGGLGRVLLEKRDFAGAEKELKNALQLDPKNLAYWKNLSSTYYLAGNYPAALAALDQIAKSETPVPGTWFIRALCYDRLHQPKPALDAYQKFLDLDGNKNPDQIWQAQQRITVLRRMLERKR